MGTVTTDSGAFRLIVSPSTKTLVFSSTGYGEEVTIGNKTVFNVSLSTADKSLQEVVVVGFGTQKRKPLRRPSPKFPVMPL